MISENRGPSKKDPAKENCNNWIEQLQKYDWLKLKLAFELLNSLSHSLSLSQMRPLSRHK